jgi:uncharacterized protein
MSQPPLIVDASVQPHFRSNAELRDYLPRAYRYRGIPDVEIPWYQAPGGDYHESLYDDGAYPGSDPDTVARHVLRDAGAQVAILNPLTRGNLPDHRFNNVICSGVNEWLAERWLDAGVDGFRGTIRVNPEDPAAAVREIERWADHPKMVQVGVPLQSREPYGKPQFQTIWDAAASHGLPVAVRITGGAGIEYPPTPAGHALTYAHYAAYMPLNFIHHWASLVMEGTLSRLRDLVFVFADGAIDMLTPITWRMDTLWRSLRDETPWVEKYPSEYLLDQVRFCTSTLDGPSNAPFASEWLEQMHKADLMMFASNYPHWSRAKPDDLPPALTQEQREKVLWRNADRLYRLDLAPITEHEMSRP